MVSLTTRLAIIRFDHTAARIAGGFHFPAGSHTLGFFWSGRHYNLYRIAEASGTVIAYRFDVVDAVEITPTRVVYTDLLLDAWRPPDGEPRFEDEEEVLAAVAAGQLSARRQEIIARTRNLLTRDHGRIIAEAEGELAP